MAFSLRQIKYFIATAETGQISLASQQLNITQSAITIAIKQLESILQTQLFHRTSQGMSLTKTGQLFLSYAYDISNNIEDSLKLHQWSNNISGTLNVAATYTVMGYFLTKHISKLSQLFPKLKINWTESSRVEIEKGLELGKIDIAILLTSNVNNSKLTIRSLFNSARRLWLPDRHPLLENNTISFDKFKQQPYVMLTVDEAENWTLKFWQANGSVPKTILRTFSVEAVRSMVANNQALTILSDMVYRPWSLEGKRIIKREIEETIPSMSVGLVWLTEKGLTPNEQVIHNYFIAETNQLLSS